MSLSKDMFIFISSFVFGYCVGYYSYNFFKPESLKDEITDFILRYNIKHGIGSSVSYRKRKPNYRYIYHMMNVTLVKI